MIKDDDFFRIDGVPITKEEIRAVSIGKLQLNHNDVVVDIGCGSGGMTVEMARRCKFVYAVDNSEDAITTTKKNLDKFNIKNCELIKGNAEDVIYNLEFNKAFIGGTKNIDIILNILKEKNIKHIVVNTIVLENAVKIIKIMNNFKNDNEIYDIDIVNISVSYGKKINTGHMMMARNPITIITYRKK
ncbi:precorrin-6Y C5,15-methyltransferase (decarboxylating) subunit CbiT [Methanothermococcus okinawensis]|uniref:Probable cobalt-precorrin-6B C(15)-methyltransferase (decarboxylating) n=1 Tax=Methanothermococcus okinawensis (strain DSM 14208 / JCM 11175 / IH1) TaxID=647113 RepID=F8ANE4_METOI|nr:precorrin-6Y C5,15-methyltransferase (decarboxylating) subunit CbiT [Methanothermococcus okinawensis]AEH06204.1 cobalt-precorrin-6Y C(15)-methyltransferase (decarboxylating) [Methanothermococcus okinawensis IH1]